MTRYQRRQLRRTLTLIGATILAALATALPALAATPKGWLW
jgi:hypothetical protein